MASTITPFVVFFTLFFSPHAKIKYKYDLVVSVLSTTPEETMCESAQTKRNKGGNPRMKHLQT